MSAAVERATASAPAKVVPAILLALFAILAACSSTEGPPPVLADRVPSTAPAPRIVDGLSQLASVDGQRFAVHTEAGDLTFLPGVNLGSSVPGHAPGELAISREQYRQWFPQISDAGFRVLRVYTILPPYFYEEFKAYNDAHADHPLYLAHGIWIPEEDFYEVRDLWHPLVRSAFHREIRDAVAAVNGDATIEPLRGHASGTYTTDVSPWLISWIVGVELDPFIVVESDEANRGQSFIGDHILATDDASPTEVWLAEGMDLVAELQAERGRLVPMAFVNWPSTDPLEHPDEPLDSEDLVGIDANHVLPTEQWQGGVFASYHAYPYYPDFQRVEPGIADFELNGSVDPYAGYLTKLRDHHADMPTIVTEFGVPGSTGHAHYGPLDRNQGGHSEQQQMVINAELLQVIADVGLSGGYVFEWMDEWFKFTWNTIDFELPGDRRAMWMNPWTNEAHFGVIAASPGPAPAVLIDGRPDEWANNGSQVIHEGREGLREVRALHDEGYLHLMLRFDERDLWDRQSIAVGFDVIEGGPGRLPSGALDEVSDYVAEVGPDGEGTLLAAGHSDPYRRLYGAWFGYVSVDASELTEGTGSWAPQTLIVNRPLVYPSTGERQPAESMIAGELLRGTSDPRDVRFDSRTTWQGNGQVLELRLPYQGIGFADPSSLQAVVVGLDGEIGTTDVERVGIVVDVAGATTQTAGYAWEPWQSVTWHQRPKANLDLLTATAEETLNKGIEDPIS